MKKRMFWLSSLIALGLVLGCSDDNPTGPGTDINDNTRQPSKNEAPLGTYSSKGDTLVLVTPMSISTSKQCNDDTLITVVDTNEADTGKVVHKLDGNNLTLTPTDTVDSGEVAMYEFSRVGAGIGLTGEWRLTHATMESGVAVPIRNNPELDSALIPIQNMRLYFDTDNMVRIGGIDTDLLQAGFAMIGWEIGWAISGWLYNVTVRDTIVDGLPGKLLVGNKTGETVTILWEPNGDHTYYSSDEENAPHTVYDQPETCPNRPPTWYSRFLSENGITGKRLSGMPALVKDYSFFWNMLGRF